MDKIILNLLKLATQFRIFHWQTESHAQHEAFGMAYEKISDLVDELVEVHQGKHGRITYEGSPSLELQNLNELDPQAILTEVTDYLSQEFINAIDPEKDTDCLNIRDEILAVLNKLKYLLTLK